MSDSIARNGMIFILYLFIVIVCYFVLSTPLDVLFDGFEDADFANAEDEKDLYLGGIRTALNIFFALFLALPITWFVMKVFSREPAYYNYRRY